MSLLLLLQILFFSEGAYVGIIAADLQTFDQFQFRSFDSDGTSFFIGNLTTVGGILPNTIAWIPETQEVVF